MSDSLIFSAHPTIEIATNEFVRVPVIFQFDDIPLIRVVPATVAAGFTTEFSIYHSDGTYLAKVVGSQIYGTKEGKNAGLTLRYPSGLTVCEMAGRTIFEMRRKEAAALKTTAELYTPTGTFLKATDAGLAAFKAQNGTQLQIGPFRMTRCRFEDCRIGIHLKSDGTGMVGVA